MINSTDITKIYFKKLAGLFSSIAIILNLVSTIVLAIIMKEDFSALFPMLLFIGFIALGISTANLMAKYDEKLGDKVADIFRNEGYTLNFCDAYRQAYIDNRKKPFHLHLIMCASYYAKIRDYNSAEMFLDQVNINKLDNESKFAFCLERLNVYGRTGNWCDGEDFRKDNIKFIQTYIEKRPSEYKVGMHISLALIDCASKKYVDAFRLLNFGYKPTGKNDTSLLNILITAVYIYAKAGDVENLKNAKHNASLYLSKIDRFDYPWCVDYYQEALETASNSTYSNK